MFATLGLSSVWRGMGMIPGWGNIGLGLILGFFCAAQAVAGQITLLIGETKRLSFGQEAQALLLTNPAIAAMQSPSNLYVNLTGRTTGEGEIIVLGADGAEIARVRLSVGIDLAQMQAAIDRLVPAERIKLAAYDGAIVLNGALGSEEEADLIEGEVRKRAGASTVIVNNLRRLVPGFSDGRRNALGQTKAASPKSRVGFLLR